MSRFFVSDSLFVYHSLCCSIDGGARRLNDGGNSSARFGRGGTAL
jgi:hypothetical protein